MFNTTFAYNTSFNQYELKIDGSKFDATIAWLNKFQVKFQFTAFSRYVLIEIIKASNSVIDALITKFCPAPEFECDEPTVDADFNADEFEQFLRSWLNVSTSSTPFTNLSTVAEVKAEYRLLAKSMHPDAGGNADEFALLNSQYNDALNALRVYA